MMDPNQYGEEMAMDYGQEQYLPAELFDENGQPKQFRDNEGNEIPFEEVYQ